MGSVLRFPAERVRGTLYPVERPQSAAILILPVVQIERAIDPAPWPDDWPEDGPAAPGFEAPPSPRASTNGRRRRSPRS
jgi:hypothetical protein